MDKVPETYDELLKAADEAHDNMSAPWLCMLVARLARMIRQMEKERIGGL